MPRDASAKRQPKGPGPEPIEETALPSAEQLKQLYQAISTVPRDTIGIGRIAVERAAGILGVKAASTQRQLARAVAAGAPRERLQQLRARAAAYTERAERGGEQVKMASRLETISAAFGERPAAYGRAVDERGQGHAGVPVALVTEAGETLAAGYTDDDGYFALSQSAPAKGTGEVLLHVGKDGTLGTFPVTSGGRLLPPRAVIARAPRSAYRSRKSTKKAR